MPRSFLTDCLLRFRPSASTTATSAIAVESKFPIYRLFRSIGNSRIFCTSVNFDTSSGPFTPGLFRLCLERLSYQQFQYLVLIYVNVPVLHQVPVISALPAIGGICNGTCVELRYHQYLLMQSLRLYHRAGSPEIDHYQMLNLNLIVDVSTRDRTTSYLHVC